MPVGAPGAFSGSINIWFWAVVGLPTLVAGVYYFGIASDLYLSEARFVVSSPKGVQTNPIGALLQSSGLSRATDDTAAVQDFIMTRDAVRKLEKHNDLRTIFSRPEGDFVTRFPGIMFWRHDFEALYRSYEHFVSVETDTTTGVTTLSVKAYRPEDSHMIASALLTYSEQLVNDLNERARRDALDMASREVDRAEQRIAEIQGELTAYRVKQKMLDPKTASSGVLELIAQMNGAQANARAQLGELLKNSPNSPQIPLVKTRIDSLDKLIAEERAKLSGQTDFSGFDLDRIRAPDPRSRTCRKGAGFGLHLARSGAHRSAAAAALSRNDLAAEPRRLPALSEARGFVRGGCGELPGRLRHRLAAGSECPRARGSLRLAAR